MKCIPYKNEAVQKLNIFFNRFIPKKAINPRRQMFRREVNKRMGFKRKEDSN